MNADQRRLGRRFLSAVLCVPLWFQLSFAAPPKLTTRRIKIPVWSEGTPLGARDFAAEADGSALRVLGVKGPGDDLMLLVVLDLTGDLSLVEPARDALIAGMRNLPPNTTAGLLRAQDGLKVLVDPTTDRESVIKAIGELPISGKAGLLDTVETAEHVGDTILAKTSVRVALLYLTDSDIYYYREDFTNPVINSSDSHDLSRRFPESLVLEKISKLQASLAGAQTPLFIVHLRARTERLNEAYQNGLKELAETTAGTATFCRSSAEIPEAVRKTLELIESHYSLTVALPDRAGRHVQVQLEADGGKRALSYRARFVVKR